MSLRFGECWWIAGLLTAAIVLAVTGWLLRATRHRSWRWRRACILFPGLAASAFSLAAIRPALFLERGATNIVLLLDLSASTRTCPWRDPAWVRNIAAHDLIPDCTVSVVVFARSPQLLLDHVHPIDAARWPSTWPTPADAGATNTAAALSWRSSSEARGEQPPDPRWLFTDGLDTTSSVAPLLYPLALTEQPPSPTEPDVAIIQLQRSAAGDLQIQVRTTGPTAAHLSITRDGQPLAEQDLSFTSSTGAARWITVHDPDPHAATSPHRYEALCQRTPTADPWPENDRAALRWTPPNAASLLLITTDPAALPSPFADFHITRISPEAFPTNLAALLRINANAILLDNVPAFAAPNQPTLSTSQLATLNSFVYDAGGGLLITGTIHAFGPGGYNTLDNPLGRLSPLASAPLARPAAHFIFLLDASGSMNESVSPGSPDQKFHVAARSLMDSLALLHPTDQVDVITFNAAATAVAHGTVQQVASTLPDVLERIAPTGGTSPDTALPLLTRALQNPIATTVILLTDGDIPTLDIPHWSQLLTNAHAHLTLVAPPEPSSHSPLAELAHQSHALWLPARAAAEWPALLRRALAETFAGITHKTPLTWHSENLDPPLRGTLNPWTDAWKKDEALPLAAAETSPETLAAIAQRGLGRAAALAADAHDPQAAPLLQQLIQRVASHPADPRYAFSATHIANTWTFAADATDHGTFLNTEHLAVNLLPSSTSLPLHLSAPGHYEATSTAHAISTALLVTQDPASAQILDRVPLPELETTEWPATVDPQMHAPWPPNVIRLRSDNRDPEWQPVLEHAPLSLTLPLILAALVMLLWSLAIRASG